MRAKTLHLRSFRAHSDTSLEFAPKINLLHGPNGAGKTNVLEALHYLCLTKGFLTASDSNVLQHGAAFFEVEGSFYGEGRAEFGVRVAYAPGEGKRIFRNGAAMERLADIVGVLPLVVLSPADMVLTEGGPEERRRFLDATLSQARPVYLDDLLNYRRALKQRNALLFRRRRGGMLEPGTLGAWDEELVQLGSRIIEARRQFVHQFASFLETAYCLLDADGEEPSMEYVTVGSIEDATGIDEVAELFRAKLARLSRRESELGRTLAGPHRDEVVFRLGGYEVRPYASQGQHRTVGLALRLATFLFLRDRLDENPLLLLDDVFGALDAHRTAVVLKLLESDAVGQSFVTASRPEGFSSLVDLDCGDSRLIGLARGALARPSRKPDASEGADTSYAERKMEKVIS